MRHLLALASIATAIPAQAAAPSPWNGVWTLDATRSTKGAPEFAAPGYAFTVGADGALIWRIPELGEVVTGHTDGRAMAIRRARPTPGLTLAVTAEDALTWHYKVARNGVVEGAGLMRLVENGHAWVDISWQADKPEQAGELVYVRQDLPKSPAK